MKRSAKYLLPTLLLLACARAQETAPEAQAYEDSVYCFNQRSIVSAGGLYGMTDTSGTRILPLAYTSLEFLSDEVALGRRGGRWYLLTRDGETVRQGDSRRVADDWEAAYESWLQRRDSFWDVALDRYEALCHTCIALALSPDPDTKEVSEAVSQLEWLRSYLKGADSKMPAAHQARFRALAARYQQYGK